MGKEGQGPVKIKYPSGCREFNTGVLDVVGNVQTLTNPVFGNGTGQDPDVLNTITTSNYSNAGTLVAGNN